MNPSASTYPKFTQIPPARARATQSGDGEASSPDGDAVRARLTELRVKQAAAITRLVDDPWVTVDHINQWLAYAQVQSWVKDPVGFIVPKLLAHVDPPAVACWPARAETDGLLYQRLLALSSNQVMSRELAADDWITLERIILWEAYVDAQDWIHTPAGFILGKLKAHIDPPVQLPTPTQPVAPANPAVLALLKELRIQAADQLARDSRITPVLVMAWVIEGEEKVEKGKISSLGGYVVTKLRSSEEPSEGLLKQARRRLQHKVAAESWHKASVDLPPSRARLAEMLVEAGVLAEDAIELALDPWVSWGRITDWIWELGFNDVSDECPEGYLVAALRAHAESFVSTGCEEPDPDELKELAQYLASLSSGQPASLSPGRQSKPSETLLEEARQMEFEYNTVCDEAYTRDSRSDN